VYTSQPDSQRRYRQLHSTARSEVVMALEVPRPLHEFDQVRLNGADHQWGKDPPKEVLVELGSLRAPEPGNRLGRGLVIKPTYGKRATLQAVTRVMLEQASKVVMWTPTRPDIEGRLYGQGRNPRGNPRLANQRAPDPIHRGIEHSMQIRCSEVSGEARDWLGVAAPNVARKGGGQSGSRRGP